MFLEPPPTRRRFLFCVTRFSGFRFFSEDLGLKGSQISAMKTKKLNPHSSMVQHGRRHTEHVCKKVGASLFKMAWTFGPSCGKRTNPGIAAYSHTFNSNLFWALIMAEYLSSAVRTSNIRVKRFRNMPWTTWKRLVQKKEGSKKCNSYRNA